MSWTKLNQPVVVVDGYHIPGDHLLDVQLSYSGETLRYLHLSLTFTGYGLNATKALSKAWPKSQPVEIEIERYGFKAYVVEFSRKNSFQEIFTVQLRSVGPIKVNRYMKEEGRMNAKPRKIVNRYYVAHPKMGDEVNQTAPIKGTDTAFGRGQDRRRWAQPTLDAAIAHAQELLEDGDQEECLIVKIVKRVRRKKLPVIVENV